MNLYPVISLTVPSDQLKRKEGPLTSTLKSAKLSRWFSPVSADIAQRDRERLAEEHRRVLEERKDEEAAAEEWRKKRNTENTRIRQQNLRDQKKEADIEAGIRDEDGRIIKSTQHIPAAPLPLTSSAVPLCVVEASRPNQTLKEEVCQQRGSVGHPRMVEYKPAILMNYYNPLIWVRIARVGVYCRPQMSPTQIIRELKKLDPVVFAKLVPQTLGAWIDRSGESPRWSDSTLAQVERGNSPGGLTTRVGVLIKYPDATTTSLKSLSDLRTASVPLHQ